MRSFALTFACLSTLCVLLAPSATAAEGEKAASKPLSLKMKNLAGEQVELSKYKGKVILVVNVASECGLTDRNYKGLQEAYAKYKSKGLVVLGFPCNQFGMQEPGSAKEISEFCSNKYDVSFPLFGKIDVNGKKACDLYKHLTTLDLQPKGKGKVTWNFEKFLLDRTGKPVGRFHPKVDPDAKEMVDAIERELAKK